MPCSRASGPPTTTTAFRANSAVKAGRGTLVRHASRAVALLCTAVAVGCSDETTGLEAVDLAGSWVATKYEVTDRTVAQSTTDLIERDGVDFRLRIEESGAVSMELDPGNGTLITRTGTLRSWVTGSGDDEQAHAEITAEGRLFLVGLDVDALVLVDADITFDTGTGIFVPATLRIELLRSN